MPDMEVLQLQWTHFDVTQVLELFAGHLFSRPERSDLRNVIEPLQAVDASHNLVVVASNDVRAMCSRPLERFCWSRIVSDNIAATDDVLKLTFRVLEYCFKSMPICVDIRDYQELHKPMSTTLYRQI